MYIVCRRMCKCIVHNIYIMYRIHELQTENNQYNNLDSSSGYFCSI